MGIEEYGLGCFEIFCVFYEIEVATTIRGFFVQRNPRSAHERAGDLQAQFRCFVTMKLHQSAGNTCASRYDFSSSCINKKQYRRDKRWQSVRQLGRSFSADMARARAIQDKTDRIGTCGNSCINVLFAGQAADFYTGS